MADYEHGCVAGSLPEDSAEDVLADARRLMEDEQSDTLAYGPREIFIETQGDFRDWTAGGSSRWARAGTVFPPSVRSRVAISAPSPLDTDQALKSE